MLIMKAIKFKFLKAWDGQNIQSISILEVISPYAKSGNSGIIFTSVLHHQYHTPQDESENINFKKLYKMTEWMYRTFGKLPMKQKDQNYSRFLN